MASRVGSAEIRLDPLYRVEESIGRLHGHGNEIQLLPPPDRGKDAWLFLISIFLFEAVIWGFPYSFGVFQDYYANHEPIASSSSNTAVIGSTALGLMFMPAPIVSLALQRYPKALKPCMVVGTATLAIALIAASFCNTVSQLVATQGVLYAIGGVIAYFPGMQLINEWFIARRATAFAFVWAGAPLSGCITPFLMHWLLDSYGFRTALRTYAVIMVVLLGVSMPFLKRRVPISSTATIRPMNYAFIRHQAFWWFLAGATIQALGFFLPSFWMPSFARTFGFPSFSGSLALAIYNSSAFIGTILHGWLVDRRPVFLDLALMTVVSAIAIFLFWGLGTLQPMFYIFAALWGISGGAYNATWAGYASALQAQGMDIDIPFIISLMVMSKGISSITSGPLSESLLKVRLGPGAILAYGSEYGAIIVFTGICSVFGALACVGRLLRRL